jgi:hypothetical protein
MAQVKWLGEGDDGPDEIQAYGRTIKKGESVEINDEPWCARRRAIRRSKSPAARPTSSRPR